MLRLPVSFKTTLCSLLVLSALVAQPAHAVTKFYKPYVDKGDLELEYFGTHSVDDDTAEDDAQKHKISLGYGVTDYWKTELYAIFEKKADDHVSFDAWEWENIFQLTEKNQYWIDVGASLAYEWTPQNDRPDAIEARLLLAKEFGQSLHVLNLIAEKEVGSDAEDGVAGELIWSSRYIYNEHFQPGFEIQSDFGVLDEMGGFDEQKHYAGPVFYGELPLPSGDGDAGGIGYRLGYLFGLSDAATDGQVILQLEYEIEF